MDDGPGTLPVLRTGVEDDGPVPKVGGGVILVRLYIGLDPVADVDPVNLGPETVEAARRALSIVPLSLADMLPAPLPAENCGWGVAFEVPAPPPAENVGWGVALEVPAPLPAENVSAVGWGVEDVLNDGLTRFANGFVGAKLGG